MSARATDMIASCAQKPLRLCQTAPRDSSHRALILPQELLIGGQFMEPSGLLLIVAPVVFPIAIELGIDPIHLGIIMVVNMEIGMITPPIGLNLFVTSGITGMSLVRVVKAATPFVLVLFAFLILVTYVPAISTTLPYAIMGPEPVH